MKKVIYIGVDDVFVGKVEHALRQENGVEFQLTSFGTFEEARRYLKESEYVFDLLLIDDPEQGSNSQKFFTRKFLEKLGLSKLICCAQDNDLKTECENAEIEHFFDKSFSKAGISRKTNEPTREFLGRKEIEETMYLLDFLEHVVPVGMNIH